MALVPAASGSPELADFLVAQAEVLRLAGAPDQAEASLRQALQFYENRRMTPLAGQTRAALASLTGQGPGALVPWCPEPDRPRARRGTRPPRLPVPGLLRGVDRDTPPEIGRVILVFER